MNPLTMAACLDSSREKRKEWAICFGCGAVFASLCILFLLKSTA